MLPNGTVRFTTTAKDQEGSPIATRAVDWTVSGGGTIDASGLFTSNGTLGNFTVTATVRANPAVTATGKITVEDLPPGLVMDLSADEVTGIASGGAVSVWPDISGKNNDAIQSDFLKRPSFVSGALNGLPVIHFDSTDDGMKTSLAVNSPYTIYVIYSAPVDGLYRAVQGSNNWFIGTGPYNGIGHYAEPGWISAWQAPVEAGRFYITCAQNDGTQAHFYIDGVDKTTGTTFAGSPGTLFLGGAGASGGALKGDIAEVMVFDRALSTSEMSFRGVKAAGKMDCPYRARGFGKQPASKKFRHAGFAQPFFANPPHKFQCSRFA